ncbi:MAG TPA: ABC transporter substrate-binding protein [Dehalococcoidia bacterium]|nr:ABC transporter substrate-binding protein [Dehalococcoidia bacterium]
MRRLAGLRLIPMLALGALLTLAVACGGSDSGNPTSTDSIGSPPTSAGSASGASGAAANLPPEKLTFLAAYKPQANLPFVGAYVAQEKGFFKDENLDVTIRHTQNGDAMQLLLANQAQITTANAADVLSRRAQGLPVVSVALIGQESEQGFAVGVNSGINTVQDFVGKKLGYKGTVPIEFLALAAHEGVDPDKVQQVSVGYDPRVLSEGQVDILSVFISNEPDLLDQIGYKVKVFDPSAYGIPVLGLTYVATEDGVKNNSDAIQRFVTAAIKGIQYAADHPDEALDIVMKYAPQEDRNHQSFMMNTELARAKTDLTTQNGYGWQTLDQWQKLEDALVQFKATDKPVDAAQAFTTRFLGGKKN